MKISYRILLGFALILAGGFYYFISWIMSDVNVQPKKSMEESLVDTAHTLAAYLERNVRDGKIDVSGIKDFMAIVKKRDFKARIYEFEKKAVTMDVYVTDKEGIVIYDSNNGKLTGQYFGRCNDVYLTFRGRYGARTSRLDPKDPVSSIAYIGAPIQHKGETIGVCTVYKPWKSINSFIDTTRKKIIAVGITGFFLTLLLAFFVSYWITRPIRKLKKYAEDIKEGKRAVLPELGNNEIGDLGDSFEKMKDSLEGRKYIEKYVQTLTHQVKGPLSAIRGASELLQEDIPEADRKRFVNNIEVESKRIQRIIDRMLELAALEQQRELRNVEKIDMGGLVTDIADGLSLMVQRKKINMVLNTGKGNVFMGERFLMHQAIFNLMHNAVEFTPEGGTVEVRITDDFGRLVVVIRDSGAGIPEYALDKIFDKFYSLQRPDTGQKSSGLGLSLVKEVADLHRGEVTLKNNPDKGAVAIFKVPIGKIH